MRSPIALAARSTSHVSRLTAAMTPRIAARWPAPTPFSAAMMVVLIAPGPARSGTASGTRSRAPRRSPVRRPLPRIGAERHRPARSASPAPSAAAPGHRRRETRQRLAPIRVRIESPSSAATASTGEHRDRDHAHQDGALARALIRGEGQEERHGEERIEHRRQRRRRSGDTRSLLRHGGLRRLARLRGLEEPGLPTISR